jgi:hypothetical protein
MKYAYLIIIVSLITTLAFANNVDNLLIKLSKDFCNQIYVNISSYSTPSDLDSLAILNENYSLNTHFSRIFSDQLTMNLSNYIQVVDREHLKSIMEENKLNLSGLLKTSKGYQSVGNIANVKGFLSVSVYDFSYKPIKLRGFFTESKGYEGQLSGAYKIIGLDSAYKAGSNVSVKDRYLVTTKHFAQPISYVLASLAGGLGCDYFYFNQHSSDPQYRLIIDSAVGLMSGWVFGKILYKVLP